MKVSEEAILDLNERRLSRGKDRCMRSKKKIFLIEFKKTNSKIKYQVNIYRDIIFLCFFYL